MNPRANISMYKALNGNNEAKNRKNFFYPGIRFFLKNSNDFRNPEVFLDLDFQISNNKNRLFRLRNKAFGTLKIRLGCDAKTIYKIISFAPVANDERVHRKNVDS